MRLVVLGAGGLLGSNVVTTASVRGHQVVGTYHSSEPSVSIPIQQLDITDFDAIKSIVREESPDALVNCAAMTDVDNCEQDPEKAFAINGRAPAFIAKICDSNSIDITHVSTDYVFDGRAKEKYGEEAPTHPLQVYGESKLMGDRGVRDAATHPLVVRPSFIWGVHRSWDELIGFPRWVRDLLRDGDSVPLFTDQRITPTRAGQAATVIVDLLENGAQGTFNLASRSCVSPFEFGKMLADLVGKHNGSLKRSSVDNVDRPARRPSNTCLSVEYIEKYRGRPQPALSEDLAAVNSYI